MSLKNVYYLMISTTKWNRELAYYTGRLFWTICTSTIFNSIFKKKAMTSYNNACACSRFCLLGYFTAYRLSSSMQMTADFPHSKSNLMWGNLTGRCELRAEADTSMLLAWGAHGFSVLLMSEQAETEIPGAFAWSRNYHSQYCCSKWNTSESMRSWIEQQL